MKPNSDDETYTYSLRANQEGGSVTVSANFWNEASDARHLDRRIHQVCLELEAALHAYAALGATRH